MSRIDSSSRLLPFDSLLEKIQEWRSANARVRLVVGAFDLPHAGHARQLASARAASDRLVALVQDDFWAASELGAGCPVSPATDRSRIVAALRAVDAVAIVVPTELAVLKEAVPEGESWQTISDVDRERMRRLRDAAS